MIFEKPRCFENIGRSKFSTKWIDIYKLIDLARLVIDHFVYVEFVQTDWRLAVWRVFSSFKSEMTDMHWLTCIS